MKSKFVLMRLSGAIDPFEPIARMGGGGGGGDSGGNDELWNAQAAQAKQSTAMSGELFDYWQKYAPQYFKNSQEMTQEAMDGTLTTRMRGQAGADADAATASGIAAANRSLDRYGSTLNTNTLASQTKAAGLQGALLKSDSMNKAQQWGEGQKWARNQDAYGLVSGMPGNAVASANSAQSGLNGMASMQNSNNALAAQNASGYGAFGATMASSMFKADGGIVRALSHRAKKRNAFAEGGWFNKSAQYGPGVQTMEALGKDSRDLNDVQKASSIAGDPIGTMYFKDGGMTRLAAGGMPSSPVKGWRQRVAEMPTIGMSNNGSDPVGSMISGAMPTIATELAKPYMKQAGNAIKDTIANGVGEARNGLERAAGVDQTQAPADVIDKTTDAGGKMMGDAPMAGGETGATAATDTAATTVTEAGTSAAGDAAASAASDAAATAAADAAATAAAEAGATAAVEGVAAANSWNPVGWFLAAASAANALSKADGGEVHEPKRKDMTSGGEVEGPGSETSDSIAAWLSDEEYVANAEAVRLPTDETKAIVSEWEDSGGTTKDLLEKINEAGLKERHGDQARMVDGEAKPNGLANGGMLGVALGSGAQTYNHLQQQSEQNKIREQQLQLMQNSDARAQESHALQMATARMSNEEKTRIQQQMRTIQDDLAKIEAGDLTPVHQMASAYNKQVAGFNDGKTVSVQSTPKGALLTQVDKDGNQLGTVALDKTAARNAYLEGARMRLSATTPQAFMEYMNNADTMKNAAEERGQRLLIAENANQTTRDVAAGNNRTAINVAGIHSAAQTAQLGLARERWGIEKQELEARAGDSAAQRAARKGLIEAIASGDDKAVEKAKRVAVAAGVKLEKPSATIRMSANPMGGYAMYDEATGQGAIYDQNAVMKGKLNPPTSAMPIPEKKKRIEGQVYDAGNGKKAIWRKGGWEPVTE